MVRMVVFDVDDSHRAVEKADVVCGVGTTAVVWALLLWCGHYAVCRKRRALRVARVTLRAIQDCERVRRSRKRQRLALRAIHVLVQTVAAFLVEKGRISMKTSRPPGG